MTVIPWGSRKHIGVDGSGHPHSNQTPARAQLTDDELGQASTLLSWQ